MGGRLDELAEVLGQELEITGRLLDMAKDARAAVVAADPRLLADIVTEQEELSAQLESVEARRVELAVGLGRELGLGAEPRLAEILERSPAEAGLRLGSVGRRLKSAALELRRVGARNAELLREAAVQIDGFFDLLAEALREAAGYRSDGREREAQPAVILDRRA
jgi:hypothetical protein